MAKGKKSESLKIEGKIFGKWIDAVSIIDKLVDAARADVFRGLKYLVVEKINTACGNDEALSSYDTEIYEAYMRLIDAYRRVVEIYLDAERPVTSLPVKEIWDGIYEVLMSRLMAISEKDSFANPVQAEKKEIVSRIIVAAAEQIDSITKQISDSCAENEGFAIRQKLLAMEEIGFEDVRDICAKIADDAKSRSARDFYGTYISAVKLALVNLNDLSERQNVSYYNELLKEEQDLLRQIVVVQVMALEKANSEGLATRAEADVLEEALNVLREAHQRESGEVDRIERLFNESAARNRENMGKVVMDVESEEDFVASFDEITPFGKDLPTIFETMRQSFVKAQTAFLGATADFVKARLKMYSDKLVLHAIYHNKKAASILMMMSSDIAQCLGGILEFYNENSEHLDNCDEKDIVKGVAETISIKIESLNEAVETFDKDTTELFGAFLQREITMVPEAADLFLAYIIENLLPLGKEEKSGAKIVKRLAETALEQKGFDEHKKNLGKVLAKTTKRLEKRMLAFKRDSLFYELSTFEEIMYYSVSRLRESEDGCLLGFVAEIDGQYKRTGDILAKYGVEKIVPAAHDAFNPKENEVLMAEESEGFKKGEIIKTVNSGYRQGEVIIMRANVIAAR
ncbi:MAG: nucleotide exchange factor GrpE [Clostridiales bacterium]|nr:nucleotide exchange factor GrpE [Clostridiales bacterium]